MGLLATVFLGMTLQQDAKPAWRSLDTGSEASLRGLSAVSARVCWASGANGTVLRTTDGSTFELRPVPGADELDFRDVEAFDADLALLLTAGQPARVYRTEDGGATWAKTFEHADERSFFDAMDFWDEENGIAFSDPIDGRLVVIRTRDGGRTWEELPRETFPESPEGEAGFAASGTCLTVAGEKGAWIGLGGTAGARLFHTTDRGATWSATKTPILAGEPSTGVFSVAFAGDVGVIVGGDYAQPDRVENVAAWTDDGGATWSLAVSPPSGYRSCVVHTGSGWLATGTNGTDVSVDEGRTWRRHSATGWHALSVAGDSTVWAAGSGGRIAVLQSDPKPSDER